MARAGRTIDEDRTAEEQAEASTNGSWEQPEATTTPCRRHTYKGGDGEHCVRCGMAKSEVIKTAAKRTSAGLNLGRRKQGTSGSFMEMLISAAWLLIGHGIEKLPTPLQEPWEKNGEPVAQRMDETGAIIPLTPAFAIGQTWKMESGVAGMRLHRFGQQFPTYKLVAAMLEPVGKYADVGQLFIPPLFMGFAAMRPDMAQDPTIRGMMVGSMIPILVEQSRMIERQNELLSNLEGATEEQLAKANAIVNQMLGIQENGRTVSENRSA